MTLRTTDFDFPFDDSLIAQRPLGQRDQSRLMRLDRGRGSVSHHAFAELPQLLREGDVLVLNDTKVIPARFFAIRPTGGRIEGLFLHEQGLGHWDVMLKGADRCRVGERLTLQGADAVLELRERLGAGQWRLTVEPAIGAVEILERCGLVPLPPYIRRVAKAADALPEVPTLVSSAAEPAPREVEDRQRYQTVYAAKPGAVAAPTAGLHFTPELFAELAQRGIEPVHVTLHVGAGTFLPVKADLLSQHTMHSEWYDLPAATAQRLNAARAAGRRVVAVGTTSVRVLETVASTCPGRGFCAASGWTRIFIYPPHEFGGVDALITNFHLPRSTLLMLVSAFCAPGAMEGIERIKAAYAQAVEQRYRFFSYGDAMLIE